MTGMTTQILFLLLLLSSSINVFAVSTTNPTQLPTTTIPSAPSLLPSSSPTIAAEVEEEVAKEEVEATSANADEPQQQKHPRPRPAFLSHVDRSFLQDAMALATDRHRTAVRDAQKHYPVFDKNDNEIEAEEAKINTKILLDRIRLERYEIDAPGELPDYGDEIPRSVFCTAASTPHVPLFTKEECQKVIASADTYFERTNPPTGEWSRLPSGENYDLQGFWIKSVPEVHKWFTTACRERLFPLLARTFPDFLSGPNLCVDNAYLFKYEPDSDCNGSDADDNGSEDTTTGTSHSSGQRTAVHTDSGCLSFTIALNSKEEYEGGGTWFEGLRQPTKGNGNGNDDSIDCCVLEMDVGDVTIRAGGVKHAGFAVTKGTRYIIGGFCMHRDKVEYVRQLLSQQEQPQHSSTASGAGTLTPTQQLEAALALQPAFDATYNQLALAYSTVHNDPTKALEVAQHCLDHVHPCSGEVAFTKGSLHLQRGEYEKVLSCMELCLRADPSDVDALLTMAQAHAGKNDAPSEERAYQQVLACPSATKKQKGTACNNLGTLCEGQLEEEAEYYHRALRFRPTFFQSRYSLASCYANAKNWESAIQHYKLALEHLRKTEELDTSNEEAQFKTLQNLYKAAMNYLHDSQTQLQPKTQADVQRAFESIMGADNFQTLLKLNAKQ